MIGNTRCIGSVIAPTAIAMTLALAAPALGGGDPACPGEGDCFAANGTPGCDAEACCNIVCDADSFCCESEWDEACAQQAADLCGSIPCDSGGAVDEVEDCGTDA